MLTSVPQRDLSDRLLAVLDADDTLFAKDWWIDPLAAAFRLTKVEFQAVVQQEALQLATHSNGLMPEGAVAIKLAIERCIFDIPDHQLNHRYLWRVGEANVSRFFPGFPEILVTSSERVKEISAGAASFEAEIATCGLHSIVDGMTSQFRRNHPGLLRIPSGQRLVCDYPGGPATGVTGAYCAVDKALTIGYARARGVRGANMFFAGDGETDVAGARETKRHNGTNIIVFCADSDPEIIARKRGEGMRVLKQVQAFDPDCRLFPAQWNNQASEKTAGWALSEWLNDRVACWREQS